VLVAAPFLEIAAVIATGGLHLVLVNAFNARAAFIGFSIVAWTAYIAARLWNEPGSVVSWGFSSHNLLDASTSATLVAISAAAMMALIGHLQHGLSISWHMLPLLLLYPIWGLIQQLLVQALVAANLETVSPVLSSRLIITTICALLFGIVHLPDLKFRLHFLAGSRVHANVSEVAEFVAARYLSRLARCAVLLLDIAP
jgi:hypothetical protein